MDRYKEQIETVPIATKARKRPTEAAHSDEVHRLLRTIVRALARSAAVAEHKSAESERKEQT
jgi:hypothetical protein